PVPAMRGPLASTPVFAADQTVATSSTGFKLFNDVRWFEPDQGLPVVYLVDAAGDPKIGATASRKAVDDALAAWTNIPTASIGLAHSTDQTATMYAFAHFDGRGASVMPDDAAGATFIYPDTGVPVATFTPTPKPQPTPDAPDTDGDGVPDAVDNCPAVANPA